MTDQEFLILIHKMWRKIKYIYQEINYYKIYIFLLYFFILSILSSPFIFAPSQTQYIQSNYFIKAINLYKNEFPKKGFNFILNNYLKNSPKYMEIKNSYNLIIYLENNKNILNKIPFKYRYAIAYYCYTENVPINIVYSLISLESNWYEKAIGKKNKNGTRDYGLMQLNSQYLSLFARVYYTGKKKFNPFDYEANIEVGVKHLRYMYNQTHNWKLAVASYNCGLYYVYKNNIPKSTQLYVKHIFKQIKNTL